MMMVRPYDKVKHLTRGEWELDLKRCAAYSHNEVVVDVSFEHQFSKSHDEALVLTTDIWPIANQSADR
jgi:hypothetical protein